jgi:hypothetical protein
VSGRLATMHMYSTVENTWSMCESAPGSPRGGTCLVALGKVLLRFGGFNGEELGDSLDVYYPARNTWSSRSFTRGPGKRSVSTMLPHPLFPTTKAILLFGEKSPSSDGHNAAGKFWKDVWVYDFQNDQWEEAKLDKGYFLPGGGLGWAAACLGGSSDGIIVSGGLNEYNERLGSIWQIRVSK